MTGSFYGYCPHCGAPGKTRERRPNGNDTCENGHVYPSSAALKEPPPRDISFEHYKKFVIAGIEMDPDTFRDRLMLAGMGLGGEAGEVCDHAKKVAFHGKEMDRNKLVIEMGDVLWYFALMADLYGITLEEVMTRNVYKLCERYGERHGSPEDILAGKAV